MSLVVSNPGSSPIHISDANLSLAPGERKKIAGRTPQVNNALNGSILTLISETIPPATVPADTSDHAMTEDSFGMIPDFGAYTFHGVVANKTGGLLTKGTLVYIGGYDATLGAPTVIKAVATDATRICALVLSADIADGAVGRAVHYGVVTGLNTSGASAVGAKVYLSGTAGAWTLSSPAAGTNFTQCIGVVTVKHVSAGAILFFPLAAAAQFVTQAEMAVLSGVTPGTASASKAVVLNADKHVDVLKTTSLAIGATGAEVAISATPDEINKLAGVTGGAASVSKAVVLGTVGIDALTFTAGAATPAVAQRFGKTLTEGMEIKVYDEIITLTNAVTTNTTLAVPAGAVIQCLQANLQSAVAGDGSGDTSFAVVGLGITGSVVKYGVTTAKTKNAKIDTIPAYAVNAGETLALYAVKVDGSTACTEKFTAGATVRVHVVYRVPNSLDDAA